MNRSIQRPWSVRQSLYHTIPVVKILSDHVHVENADGQFTDTHHSTAVNRLADFYNVKQHTMTSVVQEILKIQSGLGLEVNLFLWFGIFCKLIYCLVQQI